MPPDSRLTARPLVADRQAAGARQLAHVHVGVALVELDAQLQTRVAAGPPAAPSSLLERGADLALELLRGEREALVAPARPHREASRARTRSKATSAASAIASQSRSQARQTDAFANPKTRSSRAPTSSAVPSSGTSIAHHRAAVVDARVDARERRLQVAPQDVEEVARGCAP